MRSSDWSSDVCSSVCLKGRIGLRCGHGLARGPREQGAILVPAAARNDAGGRCWWNPNAGFIDNEHSGRHDDRIIPTYGDSDARTFVGGTVDNSELDIDGNEPPLNYPPSTGSGQPRYRLHHVGKQGGSAVYAVYGAPDLADAEVRRISEERGYARRFGDGRVDRSEEHQSDLPSLMRISYAGFCVTKKK